MQHKVEICGVNTAKLKVLKNEETQALLLLAKAGDAQARDELIAGNLRLVLSGIQLRLCLKLLCCSPTNRRRFRLW